MPLPPRDMSPVHLSLNPALAAMHAVYPFSRYIPTLAAFRLFQLLHDGRALATGLDIASWMTLACLEDASADYVLANALGVHASNPGLLNTCVAQLAAPFMAPMYVPVPPCSTPPSFSSRPKPSQTHAQTHAAVSHAAVSHAVSQSESQASQASQTTAENQPRASKSQFAEEEVLHKLRGLPRLVIRDVCALSERRGVPLDVFAAVAHRLEALPDARAVLREFGAELGRKRDAPARLLAGLLTKHET